MIRTIITAAALTLAAGHAFASEADFTLANATGYPISELFISPAQTDNWGSDILGKHTIADGDAWKITFPKGGDHCVQDVRITFADDNSKVTWPGINLCELDKLTLTYDRTSGVTTPRKD